MTMFLLLLLFLFLLSLCIDVDVVMIQDVPVAVSERRVLQTYSPDLFRLHSFVVSGQTRHRIPSNTIEYHRIPSNTIEYHTSKGVDRRD